jgi:sulfatase maturation enzyme AslB (radical SAM superfamily)
MNKKNNLLPTSASLLVTEQCNFRCVYCFEVHKNNWMNESTMKATIDYLYNNAIAMKTDSVNVTMFGGEPMLNYKVVEYGFKYGYEKFKETGIKFITNIITNCSVMNDNIKESLTYWKDKVNLQVQLSIDGIKDVQDEYRVLPSGKGTFDLVLKNIPIWQEIFKNNLNMLSVHGCINHKTMPYLYTNYKYFHNALGFKRIWYLPIAEEKWEIEDIH